MSLSLTTVADEAASDDESASTGASDESYEDSTQEDGEMGQSADVVTSFHFPADPASLRFGAGTIITLLVGFRNNGDQYLNVSSVGGYLLSPYDAKFGVQNYTRREYGVVVPPGREGTFEYKFRPDKTLEANQYPFVADVLYFSNKKVFRNVVFNHTIELTEQSNFLDSLNIGSWLVWIGVAYAVYQFWLKDKLNATGAGKKSAAAKPAAAAPVRCGCVCA